jgi:ubiquinone/menaquinone biosynthesis C-methylase UbiE
MHANQKAYDQWAVQYDTNKNNTRDTEALALRTVLSGVAFSKVLEIGCGTGKNSEWLIQKASRVTAVDFSTEMLAQARAKAACREVQFLQADILQPWDFTNEQFDLAVFSLVLEHIEHLPPIFGQLDSKIAPGGYVYIGELHPFKQYQGSVARFDTPKGRIALECYQHHISDFFKAARPCGFALETMEEWWHESDDLGGAPRILSMLWQKRS